MALQHNQEYRIYYLLLTKLQYNDIIISRYNNII